MPFVRKRAMSHANSDKRARLLFVAKFLLFVTVLYVVFAIRIVDYRVVTPFSKSVTALAAAALNAAGQDVIRDGTVIRGDRFAVNVKNGCNGLEAVLLVVSGILAFPASWRQRVAGVLILVVVVQAFNIVRVASLYIVGRDFPLFFDTAHVAMWQSVMFLFSVGMFSLWSSRVAAGREVSA